jgi:hypothetical protein
VPTVAGNISVKLKKLTKGEIETGMQIEVEIPENTSSMLHVPVQSSAHFSINVNNENIWKDGKFIDANNKIAYNSKLDDFIVFEFQAGSYEIKAVDDAIF